MTSTKIPYNRLNNKDKDLILEYYYKLTRLSMDELSDYMNISRRAISRVLMESGVNTKRFRRYTLNEKYFENIDCSEKAYILGIIYADGYVGNNKYNNLVISLKDKELVESIANLMEYTGNISKGSKGGFENSSYNYVFNISSSKICEDLRNIGLYPGKSLTIKSAPDIDIELFPHFLRGYIDGDGSIFKSIKTCYHMIAGERKKYSYTQYTCSILGTKEFLEDIVRKSNINRYGIYNTKTEDIKQIKITSKKELNYLFDYLYSNSTICLNRKYNIWLEMKSAYIK